ncbi:hypothetical protein ShirakiTA10_09190 [Bacillus safensis]|nr:hypothetical protein ShirakiTA10_09190 [Bacillus safensis]
MAAMYLDSVQSLSQELIFVYDLKDYFLQVILCEFPCVSIDFVNLS